MGTPSTRIKRVADMIRRELALILQRESEDPRLKQVTVTEVNVTRDLCNAKVFFTVLDEKEQVDIAKALNNASAYLRTKLASRLQLRITPALHFHYDDTAIKGNRIANLLKDEGED